MTRALKTVLLALLTWLIIGAIVWMIVFAAAPFFTA